MSPDPIRIKVGGKTVGTLEGTVYVATKISSEHYYREGHGYAISQSALDDLVQLGCRTVRIRAIQPDKTVQIYECPLELYLKGKPIHHLPYDRQRLIKLSRMTRIGEVDDRDGSVQTQLT